MAETKGRFAAFVKQKELGIEPGEGLAGYGYDGPYAYPTKPEGAAGVAAGEPLPYSNPDEPDDKTGQVWVARDTDGSKKPLAANFTKGMDKAVPELCKPDGKVKETNPPHRWEKLPNKGQSPAPLTQTKKKMTEDRAVLAEDHVPLSPITDLFGNEFTPEPNQTIQYIAGILGNSPKMMDRFVIEMKNRGGFDKLLEHMMQHQSCFDGIVDMFGKPEVGKGHSRRLAQALHDKYVSALDAVDFAESVDASPERRFGPEPVRHRPERHDRDDHQGDDKGGPPGIGEPEGMGSVGGQGPAMATGSMPNAGGQGMPDGSSGMPDFGQGPVSPGRKKLMKADTAAGNLFHASASFPPLRSVMESHLKG